VLRQQHRLRHAADVALVRKQGQSWRHPFVILLIHKNNLGVSRFGFTASRHVGNAVARNRAKRLLREAVRLHLNEIASGWDCLFIVRSNLPKASFVEVETAVLQVLSRAKVMMPSEKLP
jgi:ribonuclease P protein component